MNIWVKFPGKNPERIDTCKKEDARYILATYQGIYSNYPEIAVWAGTRNDCPVATNDVVKKRKTVLKLVGSHYKYVEV